MGVYNATVITNAGQNLIASAIAGGQAINFTAVKTSTHVYPAGTALQNLTALSDVKQTVAPTSVDVYNNNVVQISARVPNTGIATAYLINTIGLFGSAGGAETLIAVLTAQTPDEVPVFDAEAPAAFIFNIQMTIQNADEVVFEVNDTGTATVADLNRVAQPFTGATASAAGSVGRVPAPAAGANKKFLCGDGTWTAPADMVEDFTSSDVADGSATAWTSVAKVASGETHKSIFAKMSQMFKNIRYLYKMLGTTNISSIGNGTVTGGLSSLNDSLRKMGALKECTVVLANLSYLRYDAGKAYAYNYVTQRYIVFFTIRITALGPRNAGSSAFKLVCDGHDLIWDAPYVFFGTVNNTTLTNHATTSSGSVWMGPTVAWNANTQLTVTGVALMYY